MQGEENRPSPEDDSYTDINMSNIRVGGGFMGLLFAAGTVYIFVVGIPAVRGFFVWSLITGAAISVGLHVFHKRTPARRMRNILNLSADATSSPLREEQRRLPEIYHRFGFRFPNVITY